MHRGIALFCCLLTAIIWCWVGWSVEVGIILSCICISLIANIGWVALFSWVIFNFFLFMDIATGILPTICVSIFVIFSLLSWSLPVLLMIPIIPRSCTPTISTTWLIATAMAILRGCAGQLGVLKLVEIVVIVDSDTVVISWHDQKADTDGEGGNAGCSFHVVKFNL